MTIDPVPQALPDPRAPAGRRRARAAGHRTRRGPGCGPGTCTPRPSGCRCPWPCSPGRSRGSCTPRTSRPRRHLRRGRPPWRSRWLTWRRHAATSPHPRLLADRGRHGRRGDRRLDRRRCHVRAARLARAPADLDLPGRRRLRLPVAAQAPGRPRRPPAPRGRTPRGRPARPNGTGSRT